MNNYVALLRGVNVGTKNKLPMAELRAAATDIGLQRVQTYIQSGNLVFESTKQDNRTLEKLIAELLLSRFSIDTAVMVRSARELNGIRQENPFHRHNDLDKALQLYILDRPACDANLEKLDTLKTATESYSLSDNCFYLLAPDGIGRSKLAASAEKQLGVTTTTRNWRSVNKLLEMLA